jgi:transcriptional regulator with XRE-family HTH domain
LRHNWRVKSLDQLAERLRAERVRQGLSQAELARRARIPLRSYQRLESADPGARLASLLRALTALGLELDTAVARRPTLDDLSATYGHEA